MKRKCKKCGYEGEMHQVGKLYIPNVIIQCPECCFLIDFVRLEDALKETPKPPSFKERYERKKGASPE